MKAGRKFGHSVSIKTRKKMSKARKGKERPPFSQKWKDNIAKGQTGRSSKLKNTGRSFNCKQCGKLQYHANKIFCSNECFHKYNRGENHKGNKGKRWKVENTENRTGENSHRWKGGITPENFKIRNSIEYSLWREAVFARDNWTCQKTGIKGSELQAHHIHNFADYPELRTSIENGITLSKKAHKEFHKIYGKSNTTKKQIEEFLRKS